jgi:hypothetical protein
MQRLGLEVVGHKQKTCCPSSNLELPEDFLSVEEQVLVYGWFVSGCVLIVNLL